MKTPIKIRKHADGWHLYLVGKIAIFGIESWDDAIRLAIEHGCRL